MHKKVIRPKSGLTIPKFYFRQASRRLHFCGTLAQRSGINEVLVHTGQNTVVKCMVESEPCRRRRTVIELISRTTKIRERWMSVPSKNINREQFGDRQLGANIDKRDNIDVIALLDMTRPYIGSLAGTIANNVSWRLAHRRHIIPSRAECPENIACCSCMAHCHTPYCSGGPLVLM